MLKQNFFQEWRRKIDQMSIEIMDMAIVADLPDEEKINTFYTPNTLRIATVMLFILIGGIFVLFHSPYLAWVFYAPAIPLGFIELVEICSGGYKWIKHKINNRNKQ